MPPRRWSEHANRVAFQAMEGHNLRAGLASLGHGALILTGADDLLGSPTAEAASDAPPKAGFECAFLERFGHFWRERPGRVFARARESAQAPA